MVSALANAPEAAKIESNLDKMAERVQLLHKFRHFYDQMDLNLEQRLAITKSIIKPTDRAENCKLVKGWSRHRSKFDDDVRFMTMTGAASPLPTMTTLHNSDRECGRPQESYARPLLLYQHHFPVAARCDWCSAREDHQAADRGAQLQKQQNHHS